MGNLIRLFKLVKLNWRRMAEFELIYRGLAVILFAPILLFMFNASMKLSGYRYITVDNVKGYLGNPITIAMLVLAVFALTFFMLIEVSANIYIIDQSYQRNVTNMKDVVKFSISNAIRAFSIRNIFLAIIVSLTTLVLNLGITSGYKVTVKLPEFIIALISTKKQLVFALYVLAAIAVVLFTRWIYVFHYFTLERCSFVESCKRSSALNRKHKIKDIISILLLEIILGVIMVAMTAVVVLIIATIYKFVSSVEILYYILLAVVLMVVGVLSMIVLALFVPVTYAFISAMFYKHKIEKNEEIIHCDKSEYIPDLMRRKKFRKLEGIAFSVGFIVLLVYIYLLATGRVNLNVEYVKTMEITAHRGASHDYPENSMSAFEGAVDLGADWIELDVQQTKDGKIIVMHDSNLKRTTGKNKNVWELNYDEIEQLDCGKWFSKDFEGEKIPLLEDVIDYADDEGIKLNIELKPTGQEKDFEKSVVDIVNEHDFKDDCVITSQSYSLLKKVKEYDDSIHTVYVMAIAYGNILRLRAADNFSIKSLYVTDDLVKRVHNSGKQLYVWTVNSRAGIDRMLDLNVDNIITDNITLAKECVYRHKTGNTLIKYLDMLILDNK